jgi:hypothetical protein
MAMLCGEIEINHIQELGRWHSDAMARYLHIQVKSILGNYAANVFSKGTYTFQPDETVRIIDLWRSINTPKSIMHYTQPTLPTRLMGSIPGCATNLARFSYQAPNKAGPWHLGGSRWLLANHLKPPPRIYFISSGKRSA